MSEVAIRCPACHKYLGDVADFARIVCPRCHAEVTYKSADQRRRSPVVPLEPARERG